MHVCMLSTAIPLRADSSISFAPQIPTCERWLKGACVDKYDVRACETAHEKCTEVFMEPYMQALWNPYDVSKPCPTLAENLCYDTTDRITNYLDNEHNRKKLGVPLDRPNFQGCSSTVSPETKHTSTQPAREPTI